MEGIKRIRLCPNYFKEFDYITGQVEGLSKLENLRAPDSLEDLLKTLKKKSSINDFDIIANVNNKEKLVKTEDQYQSALNSAENLKLDLRIKRKNHPTRANTPKKQQKKGTGKSSGPLFLYLCKPISIRRVKFVNVVTQDEKILKSDFFSKTAKFISIGDKVFITGGRKIPQQVLVVNLKSWEITRGPSMNVGRYWHASSIIDGKLAVIGGTQGEKEKKVSLKSVEVLENNTWTSYPNLIFDRASASCCYYGKYTYVFSGDYYVKAILHSRINFERWNGTNWEEFPFKLNNIISPGICAISETNILILGGFTSSNAINKSVFSYNPNSNSYSKLQDLQCEISFTYNQIVLISKKLHFLGSNNKLTHCNLK